MDGSRSAGEVTGAILAGGHATRFHGVNKATLRVDGRRIIDRQLEALRAVTAEQIIVASDPSAFAGLGARVLTDLVVGAGPLGGLYTALACAGCPRVLALACDLPFVHSDFLRFLIGHAPEADIVVPRTADGLHPLCAVYSRRMTAAMSARIERGDLALHGLVADASAEVVAPSIVAAFDPDGRLLTNVNTPAEYEALRSGPRH